MIQPEYELIDAYDISEPISVREARVICSIDDDYLEYDEALEKHISSAREYLEEQLNVGLAKRRVKVQWNGRSLKLPLSPTGDIISVKSTERVLLENEFITTPYLSKTIAVRAVEEPYSNVFYTNTGCVQLSGRGKAFNNEMYTVEYVTGYDQIPNNLWDAMALHIVYLFQQRGAPGYNPANSGALSLAKGMSKNLTF